eukprot:m.478175 g.478175  ORF g.478175 m.478175 type:complete len:79 (+) comp21057_c0_seq1:512-748(+)
MSAAAHTGFCSRATLVTEIFTCTTQDLIKARTITQTFSSRVCITEMMQQCDSVLEEKRARRDKCITTREQAAQRPWTV